MAKGDHGKRDRTSSDAGAQAAADDKVAKAERRRAKKVVKVELQLADAREIQAAVGALVASLEHKLAEIKAEAEPTAAAPSAATTPSARRTATPRAPRTGATKPRAVRARRPRKLTPPA